MIWLLFPLGNTACCLSAIPELCRRGPLKVNFVLTWNYMDNSPVGKDRQIPADNAGCPMQNVIGSPNLARNDIHSGSRQT